MLSLVSIFSNDEPFEATHFVNLNSTRNLFILGFSIFFGLTLSKWVADPSNELSNISEEQQNEGSRWNYAHMNIGSYHSTALTIT